MKVKKTGESSKTLAAAPTIDKASKKATGASAVAKAVAKAATAMPKRKPAAQADRPAVAKAATALPTRKATPVKMTPSVEKRKRPDTPPDDESSEAASESGKSDGGGASVPGALSNFRLSQQTVDALETQGIKSLFPIQSATFDIIFDGSDLIGRAHTGMGKTLAFALPTIERLHILKRADRSLPRSTRPLALVMAPTRELAQQVAREFAAVAPALACTCVYGGAPIGEQCSQLRRGVDVIIGTPGRIKDLAERGVLMLDDVRCATLDEADQMLDMGFADDMMEILGKCVHPDRQTCLFSATLPPWVRTEAPKYMRPNPTIVDLVGDSAKKASSDVRHLAIPSPGPMSMRSSTINDVIAMYTSASGRVIVFCETKAQCDDLSNSDTLRYEAKCLHGDIPQTVREKTMAAFRSGKFRVLIATDVAARGLDMIVDLVLCATPPMRQRSVRPDEETYVHRSGRTGRAGRKGICVTLYGPRDRAAVEQIERFTKNQFEWLSPPNPKTLVLTAAETACTDAAAVPAAAVALFRSAAAKLLEAKGKDAVEAVAAALALATDTTGVPPSRSLQTSLDGYVTMQAKMHSEVQHPSFIWGALRKLVPAGATDGGDNFRSLRLTADGHGAVFDVKESLFTESIASSLSENKWLTVCDRLPELKASLDASPWSGGGKGGGYGGGKGGGYGGGKGGGYGGGKGGKGDGWGGKGGKGDGWGKGGGRGGGGWGSPGGGGKGGGGKGGGGKGGGGGGRGGGGGSRW